MFAMWKITQGVTNVSKPKVLALVGGISKDSINRKLFAFFKEASKDKFDAELFEIAELPHFSQDIENDPPAVAKEFKQRVKESDAILIVTPEYNRSFPGVLKNALDWGSRPYGESVWGGKPAGLMGCSPGAIGTFGAQNQLKQVLSFLDLNLMRQPEFYLTFTEEMGQGKLSGRTESFLQKFIEAFAGWIERSK